MHRTFTDQERRDLALRLFGPGTKGEPHGPLDPGWVKQTFGVTAQTLKRWRSDGIPPARLDAVLSAVLGLVPEEMKEEAAPEVPERLANIERLVRAMAAATFAVKLADVEETIARVDELIQSQPLPDASRPGATTRTQDE